MTWDQFLNVKPDSESTGQVQTDIECPACGRHIYLNKNIILTSYPCKYMYWCSCGWLRYAPIRWTKDGDNNEID